jgi:hypothetical protein
MSVELHGLTALADGTDSRLELSFGIQRLEIDTGHWHTPDVA